MNKTDNYGATEIQELPQGWTSVLDGYAIGETRSYSAIGSAIINARQAVYRANRRHGREGDRRRYATEIYGDCMLIKCVSVQ